MTRLMVLGLLRKHPMSGYEIQQFLQLSHVDKWAGILPGSIYHALKKMETEGLVAVESVEHTGNRSKAIYRITERGDEEYLRLIFEAIATPSITFPTDLYTGLLFHHDLPREQVLKALESHIEGLTRRYEAFKLGQVSKQQHQALPREAHVVFGNVMNLYEAHLHFLMQVKELLEEVP
jgi:DNA-binding PadR family transcriptional regulator